MTAWVGVKVAYWSFIWITVAAWSREYVVPDTVSGAPPGRSVCPSTMYRAGAAPLRLGFELELPFEAVLAMGVKVCVPMVMGSSTAGGFVI